METYIDFTEDLEAEATTIRHCAPADTIMHMHSSYELLYVPSGLSATLLIGDSVQITDYPVIALIAPFCMHFSYFHDITDRERGRRVVLYIGDQFAKSISQKLVTPEELMNGMRARIFDLRGKEERFLQTFGLIVDMGTDKKVWDRKPGVISRLATGILLEQLQELSRYDLAMTPQCEKDGYITRVPLYIFHHLSENLHTSDICQEFYVSRDKLNKDFSAYTKTSVRKFIMALRLNKAKQLLMAGIVSAQEISEQCGFENEVYFYTFFKKSTGMTPKEYAKQYESGRKRQIMP